MIQYMEDKWLLQHRSCREAQHRRRSILGPASHVGCVFGSLLCLEGFFWGFPLVFYISVLTVRACILLDSTKLERHLRY